MTAGFCVGFCADTVQPPDTVRPPVDIATAVGNDVIVPLPCGASLFGALMPYDAVEIGTPADDHRDGVLRGRERARAFHGGAID